MKNWLHIKKEVINLRSLLFNYKTIIPKQQLPRFEKDLEFLFQNFHNSENESELDQIKKLAKTKLNSIIRVYGEIKEPETTIEIDFLDEKSKLHAENLIKSEEESQEKKDSKEFSSKYDEIKNSQGFNKEHVNKIHKEIDDYHNMIHEAYRIANDSVIEEKVKEYEKNKDETIKKYKDKVKSFIQDICVKKDISNLQETLNSIDFDKLTKHFIEMEINPDDNNEKNKNFQDDLLASFENILSGNRKTEDLFVNFRKDTLFTIQNNEDLKTFLDQKLEKIMEDENLSDAQKANTFIKEQWKAENEILKEKLDGEIRLNPYGNVEFDFFKENEEKNTENLEESTSTNGVSKIKSFTFQKLSIGKMEN